MDTCLHSTVSVADFNRLPADLEQFKVQSAAVPEKPFSDQPIVQAAKALILKKNLITLQLGEIVNSNLPAILKSRDENSFFLACVAKEQNSSAPTDCRKQAAARVLIPDSGQTESNVLSQQDFKCRNSQSILPLTYWHLFHALKRKACGNGK